MFTPPDVLLLGPGPSPTSPAVQRAQSMPLIGHLDPAFTPLLDAVQQGLRDLFGVHHALTLPLAGTGTLAIQRMAFSPTLR